MRPAIVYVFEGIGPDLDLVPLAGRRALDHAGAKLGLEAWRALPLEARRAIVGLGSAELVNAEAIRAALEGAPHTPCAGRPEPGAEVVPDEISDALVEAGLRLERWATLRPLDRWALASLAGRGRRESLAQLVAELAP